MEQTSCGGKSGGRGGRKRRSKGRVEVVEGREGEWKGGGEKRWKGGLESGKEGEREKGEVNPIPFTGITTFEFLGTRTSVHPQHSGGDQVFTGDQARETAVTGRCHLGDGPTETEALQRYCVPLASHGTCSS